MRWIEITIETTSEASEAMVEMLVQLGADGISVCDPEEISALLSSPESLAYADEGFLNSLGEDTVVRVYFAEFDEGIRLGLKDKEYENPTGVGSIYGQIASGIHSQSEVISIIQEQIDEINKFLPAGKGIVGSKYVAEEDWANSWKKYYSTIKPSEHIVISPSWENYDPLEHEIVISLDPGSAFGTGTHETTAMCLRLLDRSFTRDSDLPDGASPEKSRIDIRKCVLDVGCGSGILSIAAAKLGADYVEAIDIDRLAVDVAKENCKKNKTDIHCHTGELKDALRSDYTLVIANIVAEIITSITPDIPFYMVPGGYYLVSGIIDTKKDMVLEACRNSGFKVIDFLSENDWWAYLFQKI